MLNKPNIAKIKEAVLFLLNNASDDLDQYKIAKAIFWADVNHLNKFGRPVTYDNYVAMKFGPVPSKTYEFLSRNPEQLEVAIRERAGNIFIYMPLRPHNELELSGSDEFELSEALGEVQSSPFHKTMNSTHKHVAWQTARNNRTNDAPQMDYALLFQTPDHDRADFIAKFSTQDGCTT